MTVCFLIAVPILVAGAALMVTGRPKAAALGAQEVPAGRYRTRRVAGFGVAVFACVLMKVGSLTAAVPGWLTVTADLIVIVAIAVLAATLGHRRSVD
jgi:hypothetical protein